MKRIIIGFLLAVVGVIGVSMLAEAAKPPIGTITGPAPAAPVAGDSVTFDVTSNADNQWVSVFCWVPDSQHSSATLLFGSQQSHTLGEDTFGPLPGPAECVAQLWTFVKGHPPTNQLILDTLTFDVT